MMMERKLVRQGRDALTMTLPAKWLKQKGLKAGDSVFIEQHDAFLKLNTSTKVKYSETTINARELIGTMSWHAIIARYIEGYDRIEISHNDSKSVQRFCTQLIGMIIEEHSSKRTVIKTIISQPENNIDVLINRIMNMFIQLSRILEDISLKEADASDLKTQEELLDHTIYYCMRYLNKYSVDDKSYRYFLLCYMIEEAGDILKNVAKFSPSKRLVQIIRENIEKYVHNMSKGDFKKAYSELRIFRNAVEGKDFVNGIAFELAETLYNNLGYMISKE
jgi:phosphate uptake regulator